MEFANGAQAVLSSLMGFPIGRASPPPANATTALVNASSPSDRLCQIPALHPNIHARDKAAGLRAGQKNRRPHQLPRLPKTAPFPILTLQIPAGQKGRGLIFWPE